VAKDHTNGELRTNVEDLMPHNYVVKPRFITTHWALKKQQIVRHYLHTTHRSSCYILT